MGAGASRGPRAWRGERGSWPRWSSHRTSCVVALLLLSLSFLPGAAGSPHLFNLGHTLSGLVGSCPGSSPGCSIPSWSAPLIVLAWWTQRPLSEPGSWKAHTTWGRMTRVNDQDTQAENEPWLSHPSLPAPCTAQAPGDSLGACGTQGQDTPPRCAQDPSPTRQCFFKINFLFWNT